MVQKTKKEHYVPQVYLRRFCNSEEKSNVYDKIKDEIRLDQDLKDLASERFFYDLDLISYNQELKDRGEKTLDELFPGFEKIDSQYIEHMFSNGIENSYRNIAYAIIDKLLCQGDWWINNCYGITQEEKIYLALWVSHQIVRTKSFRETVSKLHEALAKTITEFTNNGIPDDEKIEVVARTDKKAKKAMHADMIVNSKTITHFAEVLFNHSWIIAINKSSIPFVSSDNPVSTIPHENKPNINCSGLASRKVEVFFPISPYVGIMMFEKEWHFENLDRRCIIMNDPEEVKQYNIVTLCNSYRIIISNYPNLSFYQEYTRKHPDICTKNISLFIAGKTFRF